MVYRAFSRDVTAAMLMSLNKVTGAILVFPTNPAGIELYSYENIFFFLVVKRAHCSREWKRSKGEDVVANLNLFLTVRIEYCHFISYIFHVQD